MKREKRVISDLRIILGRSKRVKKIFLPIYQKWNKWRKNRLFKKKGMRILYEFDKVMHDNNINYTVFAGTLLGVVREKHLLKHDLDLDTALFCSDWSPRINELLQNAGFRLHHTFIVEDGLKGREETYVKEGINIDIFYIYEDNDSKAYYCDYHGSEGLSIQKTMEKYGFVHVRKLTIPYSRTIKRVPLEEIEVNIPDNYKEWLEGRYGEDYMIPNPNYHDKEDNPHICEWEGIRAKLIAFN